MRRVAGCLLSVVCLAACRTVAPIPSVIPAPAEWQPRDGSFIVSARTPIVFAKDTEWTARYFADLVARTRGLSLQVRNAPAQRSISFALDDRITADEGYELRIAPQGVVVSARDRRGLLYGAVTLWELMTADAARGRVRLHATDIHDAPRFAWRGLMLDSARHYQSPAFIEHFIDTMAVHKLNVLHWHLTDDQAWRLEIKKYPRLAEVGGWRHPAGAGKQQTIGGIYTQDVVRHLVAYAAERGITIVPEIEMPGHASAAIVAYPQLASIGDPPSAVPSDWGVYRNLYNVDESTFAFLEDVLEEVIALFPSRYIHVGGDEAVKDQWRTSPQVQARMRELGVENETKLQSWFVKRIEQFLTAHGRRLIGWDEILEGGIAPEATVMSWRGLDGAVAAARAGHDAVLSPWPTLYFDNRQSADQDWPPGRGRVISVEQIYAFDPLPPALTAAEQPHILGLQGNIWTEHIRTEERVELMTWPRGAAVAEVAWSPKEKRDWPGFRDRLAVQQHRYDALGVRAYRDAAPSSRPFKPCSDKLVLMLEDDAPVDVDRRAVFLIDIMQPCWIYPAVDLAAGATLQAAVGQVPFNFQIGDDVKKIQLLPPATPDGELNVYAGGCAGPLIASLPLAPAVANDAVTVLPPVELVPPDVGRVLQPAGRVREPALQDLCFRFTQRQIDPMWAIQSLEIKRHVESDTRRTH